MAGAGRWGRGSAEVEYRAGEFENSARADPHPTCPPTFWAGTFEWGFHGNCCHGRWLLGGRAQAGDGAAAELVPEAKARAEAASIAAGAKSSAAVPLNRDHEQLATICLRDSQLSSSAKGRPAHAGAQQRRKPLMTKSSKIFQFKIRRLSNTLSPLTLSLVWV